VIKTIIKDALESSTYIYRPAAASACLLFALVGFAHTPAVQLHNNDVANATQKVDIKIEIRTIIQPAATSIAMNTEAAAK
jgi:hypothetical protein